MKPVRRRDLLVLALGLAVAAWLLVRTWYGALPPLHWWLPVPMAVLALALALAAWTVRRRPVEPMLVARLAVLAQAGAYVGAVFVGVWAGVLAHVGPAVGRLAAAAGDSLAALLGIACSAALVAGALWLESVCRVPPEQDDPGAEA